MNADAWGRPVDPTELSDAVLAKYHAQHGPIIPAEEEARHRRNGRPAGLDFDEAFGPDFVEVEVGGSAPPEEPWPDAMGGAAMHGIAGEFVRMVDPVTEADPAAVLLQFLEIGRASCRERV